MWWLPALRRGIVPMACYVRTPAFAIVAVTAVNASHSSLKRVEDNLMGDEGRHAAQYHFSLEPAPARYKSCGSVPNAAARTPLDHRALW